MNEKVTHIHSHRHAHQFGLWSDDLVHSHEHSHTGPREKNWGDGAYHRKHKHEKTDARKD